MTQLFLSIFLLLPTSITDKSAYLSVTPIRLSTALMISNNKKNNEKQTINSAGLSSSTLIEKFGVFWDSKKTRIIQLGTTWLSHYFYQFKI